MFASHFKNVLIKLVKKFIAINSSSEFMVTKNLPFEFFRERNNAEQLNSPLEINQEAVKRCWRDCFTSLRSWLCLNALSSNERDRIVVSQMAYWP